MPLVTVAGGLAVGEDRVAGARDAAPVDREGRELLDGPLGTGGRDRLRAREPGVLLAAPAEAGLDRIAVRAHVVAVQVEADLEPERVAGAEAAGRHPGREQLPPELGRIVGGEEDLDAVLARVAGAADERVGHRPRRAGPSASAAEARRRQPGDGRAGLGPLDGDHREVGGESTTSTSKPARPARGSGRGRSRGWRRWRRSERHVPVVEQVGEEVVEDPAVVGAEARVLGPSDGELRDVVADDALEEGLARPGRVSRSGPCGRRRTCRCARARPRARRRRPRTGRASPSRRTGPSRAPAATCSS